MGYYTDYELTIEDHDFDVMVADLQAEVMAYGLEVDWRNLDVVRKHDEISEYPFESIYAGKLHMHATWYDHEQHMIVLSKGFPNYTFILSGEGEENGDMWRKEFCNGAMKKFKAQITFVEEE